MKARPPTSAGPRTTIFATRYRRIHPHNTPEPAVTTPKITVSDLRALLGGPSETPVLYVDPESSEPKLTVWDKAYVSHHHIVIRKDELIDVFDGMLPEDEITDGDLEEAIETCSLQATVDEICLAAQR